MFNKSLPFVVLSALTLSSGLVVFLGASQEPYLVFRPSQALMQVGLGSGLLLLWAQWVGVVSGEWRAAYCPQLR